MYLSKVRLDPPQGVFVLRGYSEAGSPVPLSEEMRSFKVVGRVTIAGHVAVISGLNGDLKDPDLWADLDKELAGKDVTEVIWERHKGGKVLVKKRKIKYYGRTINKSR